jgi:hypothetical protein
MFLWKPIDELNEIPAGEFILAPGQERPTVITLYWPTGEENYFRDPRDADRYVLSPAPNRTERVLHAATTLLKADEIAMGTDEIKPPGEGE